MFMVSLGDCYAHIRAFDEGASARGPNIDAKEFIRSSNVCQSLTNSLTPVTNRELPIPGRFVLSYGFPNANVYCA